ncbi:putative phenazine biosynthesis-like domain-containing protein [Apostichopus japonicus]|uniref:Putative phenazine biosynthesis-like domain-containing protein n=1 Tax=Stichopus japonicus TaxID=307972 RepID=A0A2G8JP70_STIJA|nr:putative phenazine biosynthesis-like domain-containing protein [Apostichopus japonicus]
MKTFELYFVDAFASKPFTGNPAAVCLVEYEGGLSEDEKQKIATEMNQAETAFIQLLNPGDTFEKASEFKLQWFTPVMEVNLCGHATLASSATLLRVKGNNNDSIKFQTRSGRLVAKKKGDCIAINLPINRCNSELPQDTDEIVQLAVGAHKPIDVQFAPGANSEILIRLPDDVSRTEFEAICPDMHGLLQVYNFKGAPGVILTVKGNKDTGAVDEGGRPFDFLSRYFDPWNGIPEDPVTGKNINC